MGEWTSSLGSDRSCESGRLRRALAWVREHPRGVLLGAGLLLFAYWALRGYVPALGGGLLPPPVLTAIEAGYRVCILDIAIHPGDVRQPSCGEVRVHSQEDATIPPERAQEGIERAVCYQVDITTPYWTTERVTRHEVVFHGRRVSKVALFDAGEWLTFPDNDRDDYGRWVEFGCTADYESGPTTETS